MIKNCCIANRPCGRFGDNSRSFCSRLQNRLAQLRVGARRSALLWDGCRQNQMMQNARPAFAPCGRQLHALRQSSGIFPAHALRHDAQAQGALCIPANGSRAYKASGCANRRLKSGTMPAFFAMPNSVLMDSSPASDMSTVFSFTYMRTNFAIRSWDLPLP